MRHAARSAEAAGEKSPGRFAGWIAPVVWVLLVVLGSLAWAWTGRLQRTEANRAFNERTRVAATFTADYVNGTLSRYQRDAAWMLAEPTVGQHQLALFCRPAEATPACSRSC